MLRAIREIQPRWVVGENVRGLTNWNGGLVFDEVQSDLENEGYEVTPYLLPACSVNAPHRRDRIWFVAYNAKQVPNGRHNGGTSQRNGMDMERNGMVSSGRQQGADNFKPSISDAANPKETGSSTLRIGIKKESTVNGIACGNGPTTNPGEARHERSKQPGAFEQGIGRQQPSRPTSKLHKVVDWQQFPTKPPVCSRNDGISDGLAGITFSNHRKKSIGAYGNAIVPQVAFQIFKAIQQYENLNNT